MSLRHLVFAASLSALTLPACGDDASMSSDASGESAGSESAGSESTGSGSESTEESTSSDAGDGDGDSDAGTSSSGDGDTDATSEGGDGDSGPAPDCYSYDSMEEEFAPVQTAGAGLPAGAESMTWSLPTTWTYVGPFSGSPGSPASHEGTDYVHDDMGVPEVGVVAAADGEVVYVRSGCPQSQLFGFNNSLRECGSGWGNHVVVAHGGGVFTRYAHLHPDGIAVLVGDGVVRGESLGVMGNSGRSDQRHLHFELASHSGSFDPCQAAQSMDTVYDPEGLSFQ